MVLDCGWLARMVAIRCGVAMLESSGLCRKAQNRQRTPLGRRGAARGGEDCVLPYYLLDPRRLSQAWKAGRSAPEDSDRLPPSPTKNAIQSITVINTGTLRNKLGQHPDERQLFFTTRSILNHQHPSCSPFIFCYCADS